MSLFAELSQNDKSFNGFIENMSETGIFKRVFTDAEITGFSPGSYVDVNFMLPDDEFIDLKCCIKWLSLNKQPFSELIYNMGMEISSPPSRYLDFVRSLYS